MMDYRQQVQGQIFPGFSGGGFPNHTMPDAGFYDRQPVNRRLDRLERQMNQLDRRVDRIERRLGMNRPDFETYY